MTNTGPRLKNAADPTLPRYLLAGLALMFALTGCTGIDTVTPEVTPATTTETTVESEDTGALVDVSEPFTAPAPETTAGSTPAAAGSAREFLEALAVKGRAPKTGYDRDLFGSAWTDVDRNGCDQRIICTRRPAIEGSMAS
ncbi:hypothetical protein LG284_08450 [Citricoccus nitrophenolicus]